MALPKYDELYGDVLRWLGEHGEQSQAQLRAGLAAVRGLSAQDLQELLPSGKVVWAGRVGWAVTYLHKAGLLEHRRRGVYALSAEGGRVLRAGESVDNAFLERYESFRAFTGVEPQGAGAMPGEGPALQEGSTPRDALEDAYRLIRSAVADELLDEVCAQSAAFFENLVVQLLLKMGYGGAVEGAGIVTGRTGDEGIDGIIREDKLGFSLIYIQAKKWDRGASAGRPEVQKFVGALAGQGAAKGLFITTAQFTQEARDYAARQHTAKAVLVDGAQLAALLMEYDLGVSTEAVYAVKRVDTDFFAEG